MKGGFRLLWAGQAAANLADVFYIIVVVTFIFKQTGSALLAGAFPFVRVSGQLLSSLVAPLVMDRVRLSALLVYAQAAQTVLLLTLAVLMGVLDHGVLWVVGVFVFFISFLHGWINPVRNALVPRLLPPERLVRANSALAITDEVVMLAGWSLGGVCVSSFGGTRTLALSVGLWVLASVCFACLRSPGSQPVTDPVARVRWAGVLEGWSTLWRRPVLRIVLWMDILEQLAGGVWVGAILLVYVTDVLHRGDDWWGYINTSASLGAIGGGLLVVALAAFVERHLFLVMVAGSAIFSLVTLGFAITSAPVWALALCLLTGPAAQLRDIAQSTILQRTVPADVLPKVYAAQGAVVFGMFALSVLLMGALADAFGVRAAYLVAALLLGASAALACILGKQGGISHSAGMEVQADTVAGGDQV